MYSFIVGIVEPEVQERASKRGESIPDRPFAGESDVFKQWLAGQIAALKELAIFLARQALGDDVAVTSCERERLSERG